MSVTAALDTNELFSLLESNEVDVNEIKALIHENLNQTKEPSYLNSLVDFYINTGLSRCQEILVGIREPHDKHLFDKLNDCLKSGTSKMQALTLLGHVVHKQPSWLYKISQHALLHSLIRVLKTDTEIPVIMSGLLIIVALLPVIPSAVGTCLSDIFDVFTRISGWYTKKPANMPDIFLVHLHVALYALFQRLYSMYPCNFVSYLRTYCSNNREHLQIFSETIRPMLECVRMHPLLVTFSKEAEIATTRWKAMETHDIVVECAKLSLDPIEGTRESQNLAGTLQSNIQKLRYSLESGSFKRHQQLGINFQHSLSKLSLVPSKDSVIGQAVAEPASILSPSISCGLSTPPLSQQISPTSSLVSDQASGLHTTSVLGSRLSHYRESPQSEIHYTAEGASQGQTIEKQGQGKAATASGSSTPCLSSIPPSPLKMDGSHFRFPAVPDSTKLLQTDASLKSNIIVPTPVKCVRIPLGKSVTHTPLTLNRVAQKLEQHQQLRATDREDSEVASIIGGGLSSHWDISSGAAQSSSTPVSHRPSSNVSHRALSRSGRGSAQWCQSPYFESLQVSQRARSYSQGKKIPRRATVEVDLSSRRSSFVKIHSRSWPDLRSTSLTTPSFEDERFSEVLKQGVNYNEFLDVAALSNVQHHTFPYEHLFTVALPQGFQSSLLYCPDSKQLQLPSTKGSVPSLLPSPLFAQMSPPEILDRYLFFCDSVQTMKVSSTTDSKEISKDKVGEIEILRGQLQLLHTQLLYERHKREIHAERNRRLLGKAKQVKALEEQNLAIKDQMQLLENEIATRSEIALKLRQEKQRMQEEKDAELRQLREENRAAIEAKTQLDKALQSVKTELREVQFQEDFLRKELEKTQSEMFNIHHELQFMQEQVSLNLKLKNEVEKLNRQLLLMTELNQKFQEKNSLHNDQQYEVELSSLQESYIREISSLRAAVNWKEANMDSLRGRITDLENLAVKKEKSISEQKRILKTTKEAYELQIKAVEDKHNARRLICQHFESDILRLYHKLEKIRAETRSSQRLKESKVKLCEKNVSAVSKSVCQGVATLVPPMTATATTVASEKEHQTQKPGIEVSISEIAHQRKVSDPIDIGSGVGAKQRFYIMGEKRIAESTDLNTQLEDSEENKDDPCSREILNEERISGALEPITSQSLASIVDAEELCD